MQKRFAIGQELKILGQETRERGRVALMVIENQNFNCKFRRPLVVVSLCFRA